MLGECNRAARALRGAEVAGAVDGMRALVLIKSDARAQGFPRSRNCTRASPHRAPRAAASRVGSARWRNRAGRARALARGDTTCRGRRGTRTARDSLMPALALNEIQEIACLALLIRDVSLHERERRIQCHLLGAIVEALARARDCLARFALGALHIAGCRSQ
jgi:hypothetical protein